MVNKEDEHKHDDTYNFCRHCLLPLRALHSHFHQPQCHCLDSLCGLRGDDQDSKRAHQSNILSHQCQSRSEAIAQYREPQRTLFSSKQSRAFATMTYKLKLLKESVRTLVAGRIHAHNRKWLSFKNETWRVAVLLSHVNQRANTGGRPRTSMLYPYYQNGREELRE